MVSSSLEKSGKYRIETARDGQQALQRVQASPPQLIITDVMMPVMDGWAFVQQLRNIPQLAQIPVLFLTALGKDEDRLSALGLTPDDYVSKPFRFDELERRVRELLAGRTQPSQRSPTQAPPLQATLTPQAPVAAPRALVSSPPRKRRTTGLNGRLEQLGLSSLLVMMEMERKGGILALHHDVDKHIGRIFLRKGQIIHAKIDVAPDIDGRNCVYQMLTWQKGKFSFRAMEIDMDDSIQTSTTSLLMEGARLIDEENR